MDVYDGGCFRVSVLGLFICENSVDYSREKAVAGSKTLSGPEGHIWGTSGGVGIGRGGFYCDRRESGTLEGGGQ